MKSTEIDDSGYTNNVYKVIKVGSHYRMVDINDQELGTMGISTATRKSAFNNENALREYVGKTGKIQFRQVPMSEFKKMAIPLPDSTTEDFSDIDNDEIINFIHNKSIDLKPGMLVISDLKWKYLIRSALRSKNIMMTGPTGTGKTLAAKSLIKVLDRPGFIFNLGSTQDARATLVGNTQFDPKRGTFFSTSSFVKAIQTENAIILLDELTRAHPDAWNILMPVLDEGQRYLRLDEEQGSPTISVANGVTFIATANIGVEYTSTRVLDRAMLDRFITIEMDILNDDQEYRLLKAMYPTVDDDDLMAVAQIAHNTRQMALDESGKLSEMISTRTSVETASLLFDGFSLIESAEIAIFPFFSKDGGTDSERTYVIQLVQKYLKDEIDEDTFGDPFDDN